MSAPAILLTGATGFVGRHVLDRLLSDGHRVVATARRPFEELRHPLLEWVPLDLLSASDSVVEKLVSSRAIRRCIHAAWYTEHADYLVSPVNRDWLSASLRLVDSFYAGGGERFVGLGTCVEYIQDGSVEHFSEDSPLAPNTLYGECKLALYRALAERGAEFAWARLFFIYGPRDRAGRLIPHLIKRARSGEAISVRYGGLSRDYIHAADLAAQLVSITTGSVQGAVNTGTGRAERLAKIAETVGALAGRPDLVAVNEAVAPGQPPVIEADLSKYRAEVGEVETRPLADGLSELVGEAPA